MYENETMGHNKPNVEQTYKTSSELITSINLILNKGDHQDVNNELLDHLSKYRTLLLDTATLAYISKPGNSKLLDSISTIIAQLEKKR